MTEIFTILFSLETKEYIYLTIIFGFMVIFVYQFLVRRKIYINAIVTLPFVLLMFFGISFSGFGFGFSTQSILRFVIAPVFAYLAGWIMMESSKLSINESLKRKIFSIMVGFLIHALMNYVANIGRERWLLIDSFKGELTSATILGTLNTISFSSAFYLLLEKNKFYKILGIIILSFSWICELQIGSRTQLIIFGIVFICCLLIYIKKNTSGSMMLRMVIVLVTIGVVYQVIYTKNVFGIRSLIESSNLLFRIAADTSNADSTRSARFFMGIRALMKYPVGNSDLPYFHNLWLDVSRVGGIIPFFIMVWYTFITYRHAFKLFGKNILEHSIRYLIIGVYIGIFINCFVEPILEGMTHFFYVLCLLNGMTDYSYHNILHQASNINIYSTCIGGENGD